MSQGETTKQSNAGAKSGEGALDFGHIWLVASYSFRFAMRSGGGIMSVLIFLIIGIFIAWGATESYEMGSSRPPAESEGAGQVANKEMTSKEMGATAHRVVAQEAVRGIIKWWANADDKQAAYLLEEKPALLSAIFLMLLGFMPFTTCLASFNQTARDIGNRGFRYLLLRTERVNIFCGRFLSSFVFCLITAVIYLTLVLSYLHFKLGLYEAGDLIAWGLQGLAALMMISTAYIAICSLISATVPHALGSLAVCIAFTLFSFTILKILNGKLAFLGTFDLERLIPWGWKYELLHGETTTRLTAIGATLGFTTLFFALGLLKFVRRDL